MFDVAGFGLNQFRRGLNGFLKIGEGLLDISRSLVGEPNALAGHTKIAAEDRVVGMIAREGLQGDMALQAIGQGVVRPLLLLEYF